MIKISTNLGSIYSSLDLRLDKFENTVTKAIQGFYKLQTGTEKASSIMDKSVYTAVSNIEKSYKLWDRANERTGKSIFDNSKEIDKFKQQINSLDTEIKKSDKTLEDIEKQFGTNSKEAEEYREHVLDLKLSHSDLTEELKKAEKQTSTFAGRLELLEKEFDKIDKKYEAFDKVGDKFQSVGNKLTMGITLPVVGAATAATKFAFDFGTGMAKISTIADTTKVPIENLKKGVIDLSNDAAISTGELNEALYETLSAGVDTAKSVDFLGVAVKAAKGGFTDTATAVDGLTTVLNSYGLAADEANNIANQMLITQNLGKTTFGELASAVGKVTPIAASLGITTEELFSSLASTTAQGLATTESVTALKAAMSNIIKPSKEAGEAAEMLGVDFSVSALQSKGWIGFLSDLKKGLASASPEFDRISDKMQNNAIKLGELQRAGKENTKEYKELSKANKTLMKDLEILAQAADSPIGAFATMFGSVEGLNSILMLTSENGMSLYNESMKQMKENTGALDDAYKKMTETTQEKFTKSLNKLKNTGMEVGIKLLPLVEKGINLISGLADKFNKLSPATQEWIVKVALASAALGPFLSVTGGALKTIGELGKLKSKVSTTFEAFKGASKAAELVGNLGKASGTATVATKGMAGASKLAAGGISGLSGVVWPAVGVIAAAAGAAYLMHKNTQYLGSSANKSAEDMGIMEIAMGGLNGHIVHTNKELENMNVKYKEWNNKVSPETQKALEGVSKKIATYNLAIDSASKLDKLADKETSKKLNSELDKICDSAIEKIKSRTPEIQKTLVESFTVDGLDEGEKKILAALDKSGKEQINKVQEIKTKILELEQRASKETGEVRESTLGQVKRLTEEIGRIEMENTVKSKDELLAAQADFNARMKNLDMQGMSELLQEKAKAREEETKAIQKKYDTQIEMLKLNYDNVDQETKNAIETKISQLETAKNNELGVENKKYQGFLDTAIEKNGQIINYLDLHNGKMLTKQEQQRVLELNTYTSKMEGMLSVTETGYYRIKDSVTGQMHDCYVEVDKATGQITGVWDRSTGKIYGNPIKAREAIDQDLKNGAAFQPIVNSYDTKKRDIWNNAVEVQARSNYGMFNWVIDAYGRTQSWLDRHPFVAAVVKNVGNMMSGKGIYANASGTNYFEGGLTTLHERGYEVYQLPESTKIYNHQASEAMVKETARAVAQSVLNDMKSINGAPQTIIIPINLDSREIARITAPAMSEELAFLDKRNAGFAYNK